MEKELRRFLHQLKNYHKGEKGEIEYQITYHAPGQKDKVEAYEGSVSLLPKIKTRLRADSSVREITITAAEAQSGRVILRQLFAVSQAEQTHPSLPNPSAPLIPEISLGGLEGMKYEISRQMTEYDLRRKVEDGMKDIDRLTRQLEEMKKRALKWRRMYLKKAKELEENEEMVEEELDADKRISRVVGMATALVPTEKIKELRRYETINTLLGAFLEEEEEQKEAIGAGQKDKAENNVVPEAIISADHSEKRKEAQAQIFSHINKLGEQQYGRLHELIRIALLDENKLNTLFDLVK